MNLTVGPLPPAVYWRRRALVLGVVLLVVVLFVAMCSGSGESKSGATAPTTASPTATSTIQRPVIDGVPPSSAAASASSPSSPSSASPTTGAPAGPPSACLDSEMSLTVIVHVRKDDVELQMKVKNISNRACSRDVGGTPQEIHVTTAAAQPTDPVVWSSDFCQAGNPQPDVRTFNPGIESILPVNPVLWSRRYVTAGCKAGNPAPLGAYAAVAKLGTLSSPAVPFTLT
jgi:hypothetical protein